MSTASAKFFNKQATWYLQIAAIYFTQIIDDTKYNLVTIADFWQLITVLGMYTEFGNKLNIYIQRNMDHTHFQFPLKLLTYYL